jgi:hypothetical protein
MKAGTRTVQSCTTCKHCYDGSNWDSTEYYCIRDEPLPIYYTQKVLTDEAIDEWFTWSQDNAVWPSLICDNWEKKL